MNTNEIIGELLVETRRLRGEYARLLQMLAQVATGAANPADVEVNLDGQSWAWTPGKAQALAEPAPANEPPEPVNG